MQGSFVVRARLLAAGTQTRSPRPGLGTGTRGTERWQSPGAGSERGRAASRHAHPVPAGHEGCRRPRRESHPRAAGAAGCRGLRVRGHGSGGHRQQEGRAGQAHTHPSLSVSSETRRVMEGGRDILLGPSGPPRPRRSLRHAALHGKRTGVSRPRAAGTPGHPDCPGDGDGAGAGAAACGSPGQAGAQGAAGLNPGVNTGRTAGPARPGRREQEGRWADGGGGAA